MGAGGGSPGSHLPLIQQRTNHRGTAKQHHSILPDLTTTLFLLFDKVGVA